MTSHMHLRRVAALLALALSASLALAGRAGAAAYPTPLPDFAHRDHPHTTVFSVRGGQEDRPMLVVYARWDDVDFPPAFPAQTVAGRYFGGYPSVANFFFKTSYGDLILTPAAETQGTPNDGVVQVWIPGTKAAFFGPGVSDEQRNKIMLQAADPFVDFASFDRDGNGSLDRFELLLNTLEANPLPPGSGLGITRAVASLKLDGVSFAPQMVATSGTHSDLLTIIHENGHAALDMLDLYRFGIGRMDFAGPGPGFDGGFYAPSAWQKLHWGWIEPTVVVRDGFYDVPPAYFTGKAFLLYDPLRGPDDYFLVENRQRFLDPLGTPSDTYDVSVADEGLAIYRVDDTQYHSLDNNQRPIELIRPSGIQIPVNPIYLGGKGDAWDPGDWTTPQRTMSQPWRDGSASNVAVRAIRRVGVSFRAYLDVRGPGVLVDAYDVDHGGAPQITAGKSNPISVTVRNTDEQGCDTFKVAVESLELPDGWTATPATPALCAGDEAPVVIYVKPPYNAAGHEDITVTGRSTTDPTIRTQDTFEVDVVPSNRQFNLANLHTFSLFGEAATFEVGVTDPADPRKPLADALVTFVLAGPGGKATFTATTDASGIAVAKEVLRLEPGEYELTIATGRVLTRDAASITIPYSIERRPK